MVCTWVCSKLTAFAIWTWESTVLFSSTSRVQYTGLLHRSCRWVHLASLPAINDVWAGPIWVKSMQAESDAGGKSSQGISWSYCGVWYGTGETFQRGKIYSEPLELYKSRCSDIVFAVIHGTVTFKHAQLNMCNFCLDVFSKVAVTQSVCRVKALLSQTIIIITNSLMQIRKHVLEP